MARPMAAPIPASTAPRFTINATSEPGSAPSAIRMPISRVRCDTVNAIRP